MPAKRRSMADFLAEQRAIEDPLAGDPRPGLAAVPEPADTPPAPAAPGSFPAGAVPAPHSPTGHGQLSDAEEADLAVCEAALDNLRVAFWAAGKALQAIRDARLYRGSHDTFEAYCEDHWEISRAQAYRLIEAWPLAERLSPMGDKLNERQVRELLPVSDNHGPDAAAVVYQAVAETDGVRVTAAILHDVVGILAPDYFDPAEAVRQIKAYLSGDRTAAPPPPADPVTVFAQTTRKFATARRDLTPDVVQAVRDVDPEAVRHLEDEARAVLAVLAGGTAHEAERDAVP